jgi:hypothetical protein
MQRKGPRSGFGSQLRTGSKLFLSVDPSYGTAVQEYYALSRVGFRVRPRLALGLEGGALGNEEYNAGMGGGFVRLNLRDTAFTLSSGVHRQLSRRSSKRLRRSRRLSHVLSCFEGHSSASRPNRTAGPAPAVLGLSAQPLTITPIGIFPPSIRRRRALRSRILCKRDVLELKTRGLSPIISMTRRRQPIK